jgi:L-lactate dehydrogenase
VNGPYGIRDVCISVPTVVGRKGAEAQLEIALWPKEVSALQHSAQVLRETIDTVLKTNPNAGKSSSSSPPAASSGPKGNGVRVTMGSGGLGNGGGSSRVTISGQGGKGR